jgi:hypothetical protein
MCCLDEYNYLLIYEILFYFKCFNDFLLIFLIVICNLNIIFINCWDECVCVVHSPFSYIKISV